MRSSNDLFQLIKSLDKNEKRYFRLFSLLQRGDKKYMLVFNAIDKQKQYDEQKVIITFRKEKFSKHFSMVKQYLYNLILSSLKSYHSNIESQLYGHLHGIAILYGKGLYSQCTKIITKAKTLAVKYDLQLPLLELKNWEIKLIHVQMFIGADEDKIRHIYDELFSAIEQYKISNNYRLQVSLLFLTGIQKGPIRNPSDIRAVEMIMKQAPSQPFLDFSQEITEERLKRMSYYSLDRFYSAYGMYFSIQNDHKNAFIYRQKQIQLGEANPHQIAENLLFYIQSLRNFFYTNVYLKKYEECAGIIEKLKKLQVKSAALKKFRDYLTNHLHLALCIETGKFKEGLKLAESMEGVWYEKDSTMPTFNYNIAYLYFATENYLKANEYLNKIINERIDIQSDIQCFAGILSLIVHFEMGNQDLLEYSVKFVHRFLYNRNKLYKTETIILDFIKKKLPKINSSQELLKSFQALHSETTIVIADSFERTVLQYFDFISWLESKIQDRPFAEIVRGKAVFG